MPTTSGSIRATDSVAGATLHHALAGHAEHRADEAFLEFPDSDEGTLTYGELESLTSGTARALVELGVRPGDRVAVLMENSTSYVAAALGVQRLGAVYVPCSPLFEPATLTHVLSATSVSYLIVDRVNYERFADEAITPALAAKVIGPVEVDFAIASLDEVFVGSESSFVPAMTSDDVAMISYTSGTMSIPKGVIFTHGNWLHLAVTITTCMEWRRNERTLHQLPLHPANGGLVALAPTMLRGSTLVVDRAFDASSFARVLVERNITLAVVSGPDVRLLLEREPDSREQEHTADRMLQRLSLGPADQRRFETRYRTSLLATYGCTETLGPIVFGSRYLPVTPGAVGRVAPGYQLAVAGSESATESGVGRPDHPGEFIVRSISPHGLTSGYWGGQETADLLDADGWLRTGDAGFIDDQGCVHFVGRAADIAAQDASTASQLETALLAEPEISDAAVLPLGVGGSNIAFVVASVDIDVDAVSRACNQAVTGSAPLGVLRLERIPRDVLGKVDRRSLARLANELD